MPDTPWTYSHSDSLNMRIKYRNLGYGMEVMTEDRVTYSPAEVAMLNANNLTITPGVHIVKKLFRGEIVDFHGNGERVEGK